MNKRQILASLNKIANTLDNNRLYNEANTVTKVMKKLAYDDFELGLGAVPHRRIDSPMNSSDYDDKDGDIDLSDYEADKVTDVMNNISDKNVEDTRPGYEKMASKKIKLLQDKLTKHIYEGYQRSDRGIESRGDDLQATIMTLIASDDPAKMLRTEAYKTGAKFRDGIILTIIDIMNKLKSDPQRYGMDNDIDRFINNLD